MQIDLNTFPYHPEKVRDVTIEYKVIPGQIVSKESKQSIGGLLDSRTDEGQPQNSKAMAN